VERWVGGGGRQEEAYQLRSMTLGNIPPRGDRVVRKKRLREGQEGGQAGRGERGEVQDSSLTTESNLTDFLLRSRLIERAVRGDKRKQGSWGTGESHKEPNEVQTGKATS